MGSSEKFCLKWKDFQANISSSFGLMRSDRDFSDVTLVSEVNNKIETHKIILAASSSFFQDMLKEDNHPHPLLYMRGVTTTQLCAIVDFIYNGEVNIYQEQLEEFLKLAENLKLKGLTGTESRRKDEKQTNIYRKKVYAQANIQKLEDVSDHSSETIRNDVEQLSETNSLVSTEQVVLANNIEINELDERIATMMEKNGEGKWTCSVCGNIASQKSNMVNHIEAKHIYGMSHPCNQCGKSFRSRNCFNVHVSRLHQKLNLQ